MQAVQDGTCLLEWDGPEHEAPAPLLKDMFAVERRKAKARPAPQSFAVVPAFDCCYALADPELFNCVR